MIFFSINARITALLFKLSRNVVERGIMFVFLCIIFHCGHFGVTQLTDQM